MQPLSRCHRRDEDRDREDRRGRNNDRSRTSSSWRDRLFRSRSRAPDRRAEEDRHDSRREDRGRDDRGRDGRRRSVGDPREGRGRSVPPSPRTTSSDVIEINPSGPGLGWLCGAARLMSKVQLSMTLDGHMLASQAHVQEVPAAAIPSRSPAKTLTQAPALPSPAVIEPDSSVQATPELVLATPDGEITPALSPAAASADSSGAVLATSTPPDMHQDTSPGLDHSSEARSTPIHYSSPGCLTEDAATPIFIPRMPALLSSPSPRTTPPRPPKARRKTLAGVTGFQLQRQSPRLLAKNRGVPIAKLAEQLLCHRMGIVAEGEQVTETAIIKFADLFHGRLPDIAIAALRALFQLDCDLSTAVEDALVLHGGEGGPDVSEQAVGDA